MRSRQVADIDVVRDAFRQANITGADIDAAIASIPTWDAYTAAEMMITAGDYIRACTTRCLDEEEEDD